MRACQASTSRGLRKELRLFPHRHFGPPDDHDFLPLSNLKLRLSQIVYTLSVPCTHTHTHTHTPTQAFATHYAHTCVFHIFRHLPHSTLSYSLRYLHVRTHTHFQQPITGRQRILNADTEYIARTSKLTTQYISTTRTRSHLYRQLLRTIRTHTHASSHR